MREMGDWREYLIERFAKDREEAIGYLQLTVEEYQSGNEAPPLDAFAFILRALDCRLTIEPLSEAMPAVAVASEAEEAHMENVALQMPPAPMPQ